MRLAALLFAQSSSSSDGGYGLEWVEDWNLAEFMLLALMLLLAAAAGIVWAIVHSIKAVRRGERLGSHLSFWVGISSVFVLLGLYVVPAFFGGVFLFLPFIWLRPRRDGQASSMDPEE